MWESGSRYKILVGHYGSGKTEIALNMADALRDAYGEVALIDLDIVNPFFRSAERGEWLQKRGIELIAPAFALTAADIPVLPAEIRSVFARDALRAVFDVGGDDAGAAALGGFSAEFEERGYDLIYVVNARRPRSGTAPEIMDMMERVAKRARLTPTGLINNTNLGGETDANVIMEGQRLLEEVARLSGVPVLAASGLEGALMEADTGCQRFPIKRLMKPEWMEI